MPEAPLHRDAVEATVVELDQPLRLHEEALVDVVELEVLARRGRERAELAVEDLARSAATS